MIIVVADDLSGAAEIGGAAYARGLSAEVQTGMPTGTASDVLVVDADTRLQAPEAAAVRLAAIGATIARSEPALVYKKVDSVLRGNVLAEAITLAETLQLPRAVLLPANPSRGRVVRQGRYFVGGVPLDKTEFAHDPVCPAVTADVMGLLGKWRGRSAAQVGRCDPLPPTGISIVDAESSEDVARRAAALDDTTLACGAADFFDAIVVDAKEGAASDSSVFHSQECRVDGAYERIDQAHTIDGGHSAKSAAIAQKTRTLFVCGSAAAWQRGRLEQCASHAIAVATMPPELLKATASEAQVEEWASLLARTVTHRGSAMIAIGRTDPAQLALPEVLAQRLVTAAMRAIKRCPVDRLCLEGGATAAEFVRQTSVNRLVVEHQYSPGIVGLRAGNAVELVIKPGTYDWPDVIWGAAGGATLQSTFA